MAPIDQDTVPGPVAVPTPSVCSPSARPFPPRTPLGARQAWWLAVDALNLDRLASLLAAGVNPSVVHTRDRCTALGRIVGHRPMQEDQEGTAVRIVEHLVAAGADPSRPEPDGGAAPVILALRRIHTRLAQALLAAVRWSSDPQDPLARDALRAALHTPGQHNLVDDLIGHGVSPQHVWRAGDVDGRRERSALAWSLLRGNERTTATLLRAGATLSPAETRRDDDPYLLALTPLKVAVEVAVEREHRCRLQLAALLEQNVPMGERARARVVPLAVQQRCGIDLVERLIVHGASLNGTLRDGQTALHMALDSPATYGDAERLIDLGLDVTHPDARGNTPMDRLLRQAGRSAPVQRMIARLERQELARTLQDTPVTATTPRARL